MDLRGPQRSEPSDDVIITHSSASMIDADDFVARVKPQLAKCDPAGLLAFLRSRWNREQIIALLRGRHEDARKVAALCVSLVGTTCCIPELITLLQSPDPVVNNLAEHALWSIWFRAGSPEANHQLHRGAQALERRDFRHAISHFDRAIALCADFAEPYNQRAIAHFLLDEYEKSLADCERALELMPQHFGAWAGSGHSAAHLGQWNRAISGYERALVINPHMHAIREAVGELKQKLGEA
jgi:tetratricopeptide (TPR) repeat protein